MKILEDHNVPYIYIPDAEWGPTAGPGVKFGPGNIYKSEDTVLFFAQNYHRGQEG
jgi:hypothetical protein